MLIQSLKIQSYKDIQPKTKVRTALNNSTISFNGLHCKESKALFAFDLDGTFAEGNDKQIQSVLKLQDEKNAVLTYATGRTIKEFYKLQTELKKQGIILPTPNHLITNNGQFVYENVDGILLEDKVWENTLQSKTNFSREIIYNTVKKLAHKPEYLLDKEKFDNLDFNKIKERDKDFWDSKISYYEWNPSKFMVEFFVAPDINIPDLQNEISETLKQKGIENKFIHNRYPKPIMDACNENIRLQTQPIREDTNGTVTALFVCPADKADGVEYLRKKYNLPYDEILLAGNDSNDISLANLTKKGASFICVGNPNSILLEFVRELKKINPDNIIIATKNGVAGILEGINKIIKKINPKDQTNSN
ncbi:MAG: HAD family hydrolase [Candidatus Gastranaerophilales bacterium]|nr:HAD family hydrolase [Candidatus Gastranaerophilales bacterium]